MAPEVFAALQKSLDDKLNGLDWLLELAEEHKQALIHHTVDKLIALNEDQTSELSRLDRLQKSSTKLLGRLAGALGLDVARANLTAIAAALPEDQGKTLQSLSASLTDKASRLAVASEINATLSANALDFITFTLQAVSDSVNEKNMNSKSNPASLVLDAQV